CLHGLSGNLFSWDVIAPFLNEKGYSVYAYDLRGRGISSKPEIEYGFSNHIKDLFAVIEYYKLKRVILLGHSFGAMLAIRFAILFPELVSGIILMDGGGLLSITQKLKILKVLQPSYERLGKIFPNREMYLEQIKNSPLIPNWSKTIENYFSKELQEVEGGFTCHMPAFVMEEEMKRMGGAIYPSQILTQFLSNPLETIKQIKQGKNLDFEKIECRTLILRATKMNLLPNDDLLPKESFEEMLRRIPNATGEELETNHYGMIFDDLPTRDLLIEKFLGELV
ncbi:MAG: alpha/beta hydrolase, partial [Leptospiraceae bacterium]|nr:alpha/beta hydrolase [Leptospiraceae bacterium]